jgi:hypothetical protein
MLLLLHEENNFFVPFFIPFETPPPSPLPTHAAFVFISTSHSDYFASILATAELRQTHVVGPAENGLRSAVS